MGTCSLENCKNECFEKEDRCILHCEKDDWYEIKVRRRLLVRLFGVRGEGE